MRAYLEVARTGLDSLHPLRSSVTVACLLMVLVPYLVGLGISKGVQAEAELSIAAGADLYVSGEQFGRTSPLPLELVHDLAAIDGVRQVSPRIVGNIKLGRHAVHAVVVGIPSERLPESVRNVDGRWFAPHSVGELIVGSELAKHLKLKPGDRIPPFYHSRRGDRVSHVVGVFHSDASLWQAQVIVTSLETAAEIFDQPGLATDLLVDCRDGYDAHVRRHILLNLPAPNSARLRVVGRDELAATIPRGLLHREGIFNLHFLLAFVSATLVLLVTSGFGLTERRREIGILKALGWQTDEVLLRSLVESCLLSLLGAALSVVLAYAWLRGLNGVFVASLFLGEVDAYPSFPVPFRLTPIPTLLAFIFSFVIVMSGTLYSTWRAAIASPREAMR